MVQEDLKPLHDALRKSRVKFKPRNQKSTLLTFERSKTTEKRPDLAEKEKLSSKIDRPLRVIEPQKSLKNIDLDDFSVWEESAGRVLTDDEKIEIKHNVNSLGSVLLKILERDS